MGVLGALGIRYMWQRPEAALVVCCIFVDWFLTGFAGLYLAANLADPLRARLPV
jgi:hypothetical protein